MVERPDEERSVLARVRVMNPLPGCAYALQRKDGGVDQVQVATNEDLTFTTSITLKFTHDGTLDPTGLHVNGPRGGRFLYLTSGSRAGQPGSIWSRRAKVSLEPLVSEVPRSLDVMPPVIEAVIAGTARDGGPICASIEPVTPWSHVL
jgi:hypothetical protein